ncbi:MAG TPA: FmdB family zinc ribbon protein [Paralcaligenes sp.]
MPIYVYKCSACGHGEDVLQKMSDPLLTVCPECGHHTYQKQVTAAGFQLKGTGWYVTDFRGNGGKPPESTGTAPHPHHKPASDGDGSAHSGVTDSAKAAAPAKTALPAPKAGKSASATPASAGASSSAS